MQAKTNNEKTIDHICRNWPAIAESWYGKERVRQALAK